MFVNAHTHLYSGLAPFGMPPPVPPPETFVQNLQRIWWRLDRALDEASLRAAARWYVAQARRAGTVALIDHHESPNLIEGSLDVLADACAEFGMAAVLCYGATERNGGRDEARRGLEECRRFIRENRRPANRRRGRPARVVHGVGRDDSRGRPAVRRTGHGAPGPPRRGRCRRPRRSRARVRGAAPAPDGAGRAAGGVDPRRTACTCRRTRSCARRMPAAGSCRTRDRIGRTASAIRPGWPAAARVALGTDGFPSNMPDEAAALAETSAAAGEPPDARGGRLDAGWTLAAERLGISRERLAADAGAPPSASDIEAIEADAREQASRLWARW